MGIWEPDPEYVNGTSSLHGLAKDNERTLIQTTVMGPGVLSFSWKASTEPGFDYYYFLLNGKPITTMVNGQEVYDPNFYLDGEVREWLNREIVIPAGTHVVSWRWVKDGNTTGELDKVWLDNVQFTPIEPLVIATQPQDQVVDAGNPAAFSVTVTGGVSPYKYQWYAGDKAISAATQASYTFVAKAEDDGTIYKVIVTDDVGSTLTSREAKLTVKGGIVSVSEKEPNDTRATANPITRPSMVDGKITSHDIDVFKVSIKKNQTLAALMNGTRNLRMDCLDANGRVIAVGYGFENKSLSVKPSKDQTLYVRVYYGIRQEKGSYTLRLTY